MRACAAACSSVRSRTSRYRLARGSIWQGLHVPLGPISCEKYSSRDSTSLRGHSPRVSPVRLCPPSCCLVSVLIRLVLSWLCPYRGVELLPHVTGPLGHEGVVRSICAAGHGFGVGLGLDLMGQLPYLLVDRV